ncbi:MAG: hypothetical protein ACLFOY_10735 [Desulfatibacillaceae bacterium]
MALHDLSDFFSLSRSIYYNLSAAGAGREYILMYITNKRPMPPVEKDIVRRTIDTVIQEYGDASRRLGPPAVQHPLRATALLSRSSPRPDLLDILTEMLHDLFEDIYPFHFAANWKEIIYEEFVSFFEFERDFGRVLFERLDRLRAHEDETYYEYVGRLIDTSDESRELVRIKMADRLDNTLDMRLDLQDTLEEEDFYKRIFEVVFLDLPISAGMDHPPPSPLNGAWRLYSLFKNSVLLSLVRQRNAIGGDDASRNLFQAVAEASLKEAQRIFLHIMLYHRDTVDNPRGLVMDAMEYAASGRTSIITRPDGPHRLDGLFTSYFDHRPLITPEQAENMEPAEARRAREDMKVRRKRRLAQLYEDKPLMIQAALAFVSIFHAFLSDREYYVQGIRARGLAPSDDV